MKFSVKEIAHLLNGTIEGDKDIVIDKVGALEKAGAGSISFLANPKYENFIYSTEASAVIVNKDFTPAKPVKPTLIKVADPYVGFSVLLEEYDKIMTFQKEGIENPCFLGENSTHGDKVYRGAFSYIGKGVTIGDHVKIFPHVYIGDNVRIGNHTILYAGVKVYDNVVIGNHCQLHAGAVIGSDGFGYAPEQNGSYKKIPQLGNVILEDNVEIGANTTIDCATMESTFIRKGAKIDNLVMIAHNVDIGENTAIAAQSGVSGSTTIGKNCIIAGQVGIIGHIRLADRITVGAQSGVSKSYTKPGETVLGSPALNIANMKRSYTLIKKLPELQERINNLEKIIKNIQEEQNK